MKLEMLTKYELDSRALTHWHHVPIVDDLYTSIRRVDYTIGKLSNP